MARFQRDAKPQIGRRVTMSEAPPRAKGGGMSAALDWLRDHDLVRRHFNSHHVGQRMAESGIVRITGFLPPDVAAACSEMLAEHGCWETMDDEEVADRTDHIKHSFNFAEPEDHPDTLGVLAAAVALLFEELVPSFSVAKYGRGDCIYPHDDKAHVDLEPDGGGKAVLHSRKVAGILYLSKGWKAKFGGALIDLQDRAEHVPSFNTFIAFTVPRMHAVGPVLVESRPRLSLFGWWLQPGRLYELDEDDDDEAEYAALPERAEYAAAPKPKGRAAGKARVKAQGRAKSKGKDRDRSQPDAGVKKRRRKK